MAWDLQTLYGEIQNEVDDQESDSLTVIKANINDIGREIWYYTPGWSFRDARNYFSTVSGTREYVLDTEISDPTPGKILRVGYQGDGDTRYDKLIELSVPEIENIKDSGSSNSRPRYFAIHRGRLILHPTPDYSGTNNIEIVSSKDYTELTADADVPGIPEKYKHVIKAGVKAMFWHYDDDLRENIVWQKYYDLLGWMMQDDLDQTMAPKKGRLFGRKRI